MNMDKEGVNIIGPSEADIKMQEWQKRQPLRSAEDIEAQILANKKLRESPEYQAKYNHKFSPVGRRKRGHKNYEETTPEDLRAIGEWNKHVAAWRKDHGKQT